MLRTASSSMARPAIRRAALLPSTPLGRPSPASAGSLHERCMTVLSKESAEEFKKQNYSSRMATSSRPVSPHVTIYSFPAVALSSITTRVTGCLLSFGAAGLGVAELVGGNGAALDLMSSVGSGALGGGLVVAGVKFSVAFPLVYHYLGGMRHLVWDNSPELLTNDAVEKASYAIVGASLLISGVAVAL